MRCVYCTFAICLLVGCQNQAVPLSNPFLSPDRVPPPATRTLLPGTAQPYYQGDPAPTLQPGTVIPPAYPPGTAFPSATPVVPTTPPGGWNPQPPTTYPAQPVPATPSPYQVNPASAELPLSRVVALNETPVQIQTDEQNLRFNTPAIQTLANVEPPQPTAQNQSVVQAQFADVQPPTQPWAPMASVPSADVVPREVTIRAVSSPGSTSQSNSSGFRSPSRDGFRPQGSRRRTGQANPANANSPLREFGPVSETIERFGFGPQYSWLRGQLEYDPTTQQWQLRYIPLQGSPDQFGGRLPIANPMLLGDLQPGDHVQVQGQLNSLQSGPTTTMPVFTISAVQRQR